MAIVCGSRDSFHPQLTSYGTLGHTHILGTLAGLCVVLFVTTVSLLGLAFQILLVSLSYADCGASANPTGDPIGGGTGYSRIVDRSDADFVVSTRYELLAALAGAPPGAVVYVEDGAEIDLTGSLNVQIPEGVTLASGRGKAGSEGALLFAIGNRTFASTPHLLRASGPGVRVTGLRIRGPDPHVGVSSYGLPNSRGISCFGHDFLEVDNCELWGWSHAAIFLSNSEHAYIHHNYIHHNLRKGLGYGVSHDWASVSLIEGNYFDANRHSIAGSGRAGQSYEARYNIVGPCAYSMEGGHSFDMHGGSSWTPKDLSCPAGDVINIHHNTFMQTCQEAVRVRGNPRVGATITHNRLAHTDLGQAIVQFFETDCEAEPCCFVASANCSDASLATTCDPIALDPVPGFCSNGSWTSQTITTAGWFVGDYNGDGRQDIARYVSTGSPSDGVQVLLSTGSAFASPTRWTGAGIGQQTWYVGDFNGDGRDDIARHLDGLQVYLSNGQGFSGDGYWTTQGSGSRGWYVGDFNGDGRSDVARYVSTGGPSDGVQVLRSTGSAFVGPVRWTTAGVGNEDWYVGDFNADGRTDIFRYLLRSKEVEKGCSASHPDSCSSGADVLLSTGSAFTHDWSWCNVENADGEDCLGLNPNGRWYVGDYDGDGADDIFRYLPGISGAEVFLSNTRDEFIYSGSWTQAGFAHAWYVGDFSGDGKSDIFRYWPETGVGAGMYLACYARPPVTGVKPGPAGQQLQLLQNYPNPFNPSTTVGFVLARKTFVHLAVFDVSGALVRTLVAGDRPAGLNTAVWDGLSNQGSHVSSGVYFCRLNAVGRTMTTKMVLLR